MKNDLPKFLQAISFAAKKHSTQKRKGADQQPYVNHVLEVANLLANARTHTPPGTTVTTAIRRESGGVVVTVVDDGPGIAPDLQAEIFGRFVRGDTSRSRAAGSTGLGLAIVAAVISAHGGTVTVKSKPGRTCATVLLPDHHDAPVPAVPVGTQAAARISLLHIR